VGDSHYYSKKRSESSELSDVQGCVGGVGGGVVDAAYEGQLDG